MMDTLIAWLNKKSVCRCIIVGYFIIYFIIGMLCVKDYGISWDEEAQRRHSLVTYKYINEKLFDRTIPELENVREFEKYGSRNYGVAMQMPLVLVEDIRHFAMPSRHIFLMRHAYTFMVVFIGYICFYAMIKLITHNEWIALFGTMIISLYPRYYENQFLDIKNLMFAALNMIVMYFMVRLVEKPCIRTYIMFGLSAAIATNQRIMAVVFPAILMGYFVLVDGINIVERIKNNEKVKVKDILSKYIITAISYMIFWIAISPFAWKNPFENFGKTFAKFAHYGKWDGTMVFMGRLVTCDERPWYYLFVWFGISIPILYLVLFVSSHVTFIRKIVISNNKIEAILDKYKWQACSMVLFWGEVLGVIVMNSRIYIGWHHMYFVFVPFCVMATLGISDLIELMSKKVIYTAIIVLLAVQVGWIVKNHPYEVTYLNEIGRPFGDKFDRDEWQTVSYDAMKWIWKNEEELFVSVAGGTKPYFMLEDEDKVRFFMEEEPMYLIDSYRDVIGNNPVHEGYEEVQYKSVDGYKVWSVFRKIEE